MSSVFAYNNRFHVTAQKPVTFTATAGSFNAAQPMANLGRMQLPLFVEFTGADAEFTAAAILAGSDPASAETFSADTFAIAGLQNFPDDTEIEFLNGVTSLGTVTYTPAPIGGQHAILVLDTPVSLDTLTVSITASGTGVKRIGAAWASLSNRTSPGLEMAFNPQDTGSVSSSQGGTDWAFGGASRIQTPIRMRTTEKIALWEAIIKSGTTSPVLYRLRERAETDEFFQAYGLIQPGWSMQHVANGIYDFSMQIKESL